MPTPEVGAPSPLFTAQIPRLREAARLGPIVDLACGRGRHALAAAELGLPTIAIDRNEAFLRSLRAQALARRLPLSALRADLETANGIPLAAGACGAALVFRFLYRPLAPHISAALAPGGLLLYETFLLGQRELGHGPRSAAFLLEAGELPELFPDLEVLEYDEGLRAGAKPEATARLVARKPLQAWAEASRDC